MPLEAEQQIFSFFLLVVLRMKQNPVLRFSHRLVMFSEHILGWKVLFMNR